MCIDCKWLQMKTPAKWPWYHYISEMTNSKADIMKHESISDWLFEPYKRLMLCMVRSLCVCGFVSLLCLLCASIEWQDCYWLECVFSIRCRSTRYEAMQTVSVIPLRLSLLSLVGWSWHTPGSLGLSQEPEGWRHNVYTMDRAQMCLCLKKTTPRK